MSKATAASDKRSGTFGPADPGRGGAIFRTHLSPRVQHRSRNIFGRGIGKIPGRRVGLPKKHRQSGLRRRRPLGDKGQLEVVDDPVHYGGLREEGDDFHPASALRANHRIDLIDLPDHFGPALGGDAPRLLLDNAQRSRRQARLADLPPMGLSSA